MRTAAMAVALMMWCAHVAFAATATWSSGVTSGDWHVSANWTRTPAGQPQPGDVVQVNSGTQLFWGSSFGGLNSNIRNNSSVTINGGNVLFQGAYGVNVGTGGTGTASSLTVTSGNYVASGNISVGNDTGEAGTVTVSSGGTLDCNTPWLRVRATGTINTSGTMSDITDLDMVGGIVNVTGGTFNCNRILFPGATSASSRINLSGGTVTVGSGNFTDVQFGSRYFNFTPGSTGTLRFSSLSTSAATGYLTSGYIRLNGVTNVGAFVVSSFGASGSQVALASSTAPSATFIPQQYTSLFSNNGFESGETGWLTNYVQLTTDVAHVAAGVNSGYVNAASFYINWPLRTIPTVTPGAYYRLRAKLHTAGMTAGGPGFVLRFYDSAGTQLGSYGITDPSVSGSTPYREYIGPNVAAPAGSVSAQIYITIGGGAGGTAYYDDVYLEQVMNLPVRIVSTYSSAGVYVSRANAPAGETAKLYFRKQGVTTWSQAIDPVYDATRGEYRGSVIGLDEDSVYEIHAVLENGGAKTAEAGQTTRTWASTVPIAATHTVASLYSGGEWKITNLHGSPTGWIKIIGTGLNDVNGGYVTTAGADFGQAVLIKNCSYVIFENVHVVGGRKHGVEIRNSDNIRIVRCEMNGWARQPNVMDAGIAYESAADVTNNNPINYDAAVFLNSTKAVTIERCYMHDPRLGSNQWETGHPCGANAIYVSNVVSTGNSVVRYNDFIGSDQLRWNDAIEGANNAGEDGSFCRDSDIYGNMFCFGNDDGIEMEGGQKNLRLFNNRFESFYIGISIAPNTAGPSYIYRNLVFNLGDQIDGSWSMIKAGGGTTYSKGKSYFFHNTMYAACNGLAGVGYGSDANRTMFQGMSRNNIFYSTHSHTNYRNAISDTSPNAWSTFDYDNLASSALSSAQVQYAAGQEAHGLLALYPTFVDAAGGDFRLASSSSALNAGIPLPNYSPTYVGSAPDQGMFESGASSLVPVRPIAISANKYLVTLTATGNGGSSTSVTVTLTTGNLGGATAFTIRKNNNTAWLNAAPASGTLQNNSTQLITFSVNTAGLTAGQREATVLVRLANGHSVPITVVANVN